MHFYVNSLDHFFKTDVFVVNNVVGYFSVIGKVGYYLKASSDSMK